MTWFERLFPSPAVATAAMLDPRTPIRSPFTSSALSKVILAELEGIKPQEVLRSDAMKVPGIARGRGLICGTLSRYPLSLWQPSDVPGGDPVRLPDLPWFGSTGTGLSPRMRHLWSLDDVLFGALSLRALGRQDDELDGPVVDAARVAPGEWSINADGFVEVRGEKVDARRVCLFEGPQEGLCTIAGEAIKASRDLATAWQKRVEAPVPLVELHQTDPNAELDDTEIEDLLNDWEAARRAGGTAWTPNQITATMHGTGGTMDLFIEGRNAERLDLANYLQLPASMIEGSLSTATLTYSTSEGRRSEFVDYSLEYWASPFEARLSQDDMSPPGTFVRFDLQYLTTPNQPGFTPGMED